jgi:hypothetical protein
MLTTRSVHPVVRHSGEILTELHGRPQALRVRVPLQVHRPQRRHSGAWRRRARGHGVPRGARARACATGSCLRADAAGAQTHESCVVTQAPVGWMRQMFQSPAAFLEDPTPWCVTEYANPDAVEGDDDYLMPAHNGAKWATCAQFGTATTCPTEARPARCAHRALADRPTATASLTHLLTGWLAGWLTHGLADGPRPAST